MADNAANATLASESNVIDRRRLSTWALLALFSALCLTAHETDDQNQKSKHNTWITACTSLSVAFSLISVFAHIGGNALGSMFVGTMVEGIVALILVGLWAGCLPVIMDPSYGLGQMYVGKSAYGSDTNDFQATISNANLFFTAWGCGVCSLTVLAMYVRERLGGGAQGGGMGYTAKWYLLMLASVVVIIESMRFKKDVCGIENGTEDVTCARNTYGLITGESDYIPDMTCRATHFIQHLTLLSTTHIIYYIIYLFYVLCSIPTQDASA